MLHFNLLHQLDYDPEHEFFSLEIMANVRCEMKLEPRFKIIQIYGFAIDHHRLYFPDMAFAMKTNRLNKAFLWPISQKNR